MGSWASGGPEGKQGGNAAKEGTSSHHPQPLRHTCTLTSTPQAGWPLPAAVQSWFPAWIALSCGLAHVQVNLHQICWNALLVQPPRRTRQLLEWTIEYLVIEKFIYIIAVIQCAQLGNYLPSWDYCCHCTKFISALKESRPFQGYHNPSNIMILYSSETGNIFSEEKKCWTPPLLRNSVYKKMVFILHFRP